MSQKMGVLKPLVTFEANSPGLTDFQLCAGIIQGILGSPRITQVKQHTQVRLHNERTYGKILCISTQATCWTVTQVR